MLYCLPFDVQFSFKLQNIRRLRKGIDVHQSILCFEIQFCFKLASISSEVKHRYEYTRTSNIINVRPQSCWQDTDRSDIKKMEKIISTRKQDSIHHRQVPEQLVTYALKMRGTGFEFDCFHHQACTHSISYNQTGETSRMSCSRKRLQAAAEAGCC